MGFDTQTAARAALDGLIIAQLLQQVAPVAPERAIHNSASMTYGLSHQARTPIQNRAAQLLALIVAQSAHVVTRMAKSQSQP